MKEAFKSLNSIYKLIDENFSKSSYMPQRYTNVWQALLKLRDLMELEVGRVFLG